MFSMKSATKVGHKPTTFISVFGAHPANHLRNRGWRTKQKFLSNAIELLALCYWSFLQGCGFKSRQLNIYRMFIWEWLMLMVPMLA